MFNKKLKQKVKNLEVKTLNLQKQIQRKTDRITQLEKTVKEFCDHPEMKPKKKPIIASSGLGYFGLDTKDVQGYNYYKICLRCGFKTSISKKEYLEMHAENLEKNVEEVKQEIKDIEKKEQ